MQGLIDARAPFDCTIRIDPQASILDGGDQLSAQLSSVLNTFGARSVHLIVHSKGGLWARKFLQDNAKTDSASQLGLISLTTLDTPHHGSVLADSVVKFNNSFFGGLVNGALQFLHKVPGFLKEGADDLTVQGVRAFNENFLQPPPQFRILDANNELTTITPCYYSTSADADLDADGSINATEAAPYPRLFGNLTYNIIARGKAVNVFQATRLLHANVSNLPNPIQNDLIVAIPSARYLRFSEQYSFTGNNGRNHSTVLCGQAPECRTDLAPALLQLVVNAQQKQPNGCMQ